jgi:hypothetical protein
MQTKTRRAEVGCFDLIAIVLIFAIPLVAGIVVGAVSGVWKGIAVASTIAAIDYLAVAVFYSMCKRRYKQENENDVKRDSE